ncbi:Hypothetical predicted protein [Xyrichtys novacula]|uniref:Uncharacterized protein n=1 Tax=Xyrichtys novacula TaxID=13765 RepID=A0AAV1F9Z2_XYRNO|nr:Hypothetical predicted protein [Xyrichtys novacula]
MEREDKAQERAQALHAVELEKLRYTASLRLNFIKWLGYPFSRVCVFSHPAKSTIPVLPWILKQLDVSGRRYPMGANYQAGAYLITKEDDDDFQDQVGGGSVSGVEESAASSSNTTDDVDGHEHVHFREMASPVKLPSGASENPDPEVREMPSFVSE